MAYGYHPGQDPPPTYSPTQRQSDYEQAITVACKYCGAAIGQPCRNTQTAEPLQYAAAHTPRILDSIKNQESDVPF